MHVHGDFARPQKLAAHAAAEIAKLQATSAALDRIIGMHELPVDLVQLPPRQRKFRKIQFPHGALTRTIWATLSKNGD